MGKTEEVTRRDFMSLMTLAIGGLIGLAMGIPAVAFIVGPALQQGKDKQWIRLGAVAKIEPNTPTLFKTRISRQTGYIVTEEELSVYALTENGSDFIVMSNICTHLGCRIRWVSAQSQYFCPCHNGVFDKNGNVLAGPPPRPLDRFEVKLEDGQLFILGG